MSLKAGACFGAAAVLLVGGALMPTPAPSIAQVRAACSELHGPFEAFWACVRQRIPPSDYIARGDRLAADVAAGRLASHEARRLLAE